MRKRFKLADIKFIEMNFFPNLQHLVNWSTSQVNHYYPQQVNYHNHYHCVLNGHSLTACSKETFLHAVPGLINFFPQVNHYPQESPQTSNYYYILNDHFPTLCSKETFLQAALVNQMVTPMIS